MELAHVEEGLLKLTRSSKILCGRVRATHTFPLGASSKGTKGSDPQRLNAKRMGDKWLMQGEIKH